MKVGIVNYGMGNVGSVRRALERLGITAIILTDPAGLAEMNRFIIPGVGSFADAMSNLVEKGWREEIRRQVLDHAKPVLGICLGMQLLASRGTEHGDTEGLDLVPGTVKDLGELGCTLRIPHVGWNELSGVMDHPLLTGVPDGTDCYFVHSFAFEADVATDVVAVTDYGMPVAAAIARGNAMGLQHHPEKSAGAGLRQLRNFLDFVPC